MKTNKLHCLLLIISLGLLLGTFSSCKTCNCPAYTLQQETTGKPGGMENSAAC